MNFLTGIFGIALVVGLLTGKAYYRGTYRRDEDPRKYWTIIACYAILALAGVLMPLFQRTDGQTKAAPKSSAERPTTGDGTSTSPRFDLPFGLLTDAATRLASELADGAARARRAADGHAMVVHRPKPSPEGCADDYRVQLTQASSLVIWCSTRGKVTSSHTTTSHLPAAAVPQTWIVDKRAGEALSIALERRGDRVVIAGVE